eukprot:CAMPEP_0201910346 /NCGR_PEP_ID=MMETSP0903-20130614/1750_1 /ASSEMBLY_ACC=CAM_ASM_000552 /TAXON_ID=420261 /ORGANISM="Thalassiosira antarctica, Strain CCMP982" /LENGTH=658 /DNA_ID=CAMNT_0048444961 /DNA_START=27 /DNA_END=2003 /DNA_ORIENTATION=-
MGNNLTSALTQFYSPPNPPTPLSPDKYFWIDSGSCGNITNRNERVQGDGETTTVEESLLAGGRAGRRAIPVVYITKQRSNSSSTGATTNNNDVQNNGCISMNGDEAASRSPRYTLLYCHGHDVDLGLIYDLLVHLSQLLGVDILSFEYAGYGLSKLGRQGHHQELGRSHRQEGRDDEDHSNGQEVMLAAQDDNHSNSSPSNGRNETSATAVNDDDNTAINMNPPTEEQCYMDILTCYKFLIHKKNVPPQNIILYGKSLGSGPVCWLTHKLCQEADMENDGQGTLTEIDTAWIDGATAGAAATGKKKKSDVKLRRPTPVPNAFQKSKAMPSAPLAGVILHSAFLSILRLKIHVGFTLSSGDAFDNVAVLQDILSSSVMDKLPIYLIHGKEDEVVPFTHGEGLYELITSKRKKGFPPFWADGGTHWNIEHKYATAYIKRMQQFLRHCARMNGDVTKKTRHPKVPKESNRDASRDICSSNNSTHGPDDAYLTALGVKFHSTEMNTYSTKDHEAIHQHQHQEERLMNPNPGTDNHRGRSRTNRPVSTMMSHRSGARSRSNSKSARQRKKKGTLVMRGDHEQEEEEVVCTVGQGEMYVSHHYNGMSNMNGNLNNRNHNNRHGGKASINSEVRGPSNQHGLFSNRSKAKVVGRERRDPPSLDRF